MTTISSNAPPTAAGTFARLLRGLAGPRGGPADVRDLAYVAGHNPRASLSLLAGLVLLGVLGGSAVAIAGWNALFLVISMIGCAFIFLDFRVGVVLLILLVPISRSALFPHAMFGITGANPLNLLVAVTLASYLLQALTGGGLRRFIPAPLLWLYLTPIVIAGFIGSRHIGEIAPAFELNTGLHMFPNVAGYLQETVLKPLMLVVSAVLIGAAVARSEKPERFLVPILASVWVMSLMVIVFVALSGVGLSTLASSTQREFLSALGLHANDLGRLYTVAYALLLFTWAESKERGLRMMLLASMGVVVVALMLTFSRSAFLGFIFVNLLFLLWRFNAKTFFLFVALIAVGALLVPGAVYERLSYGMGEGADAISAGRVEGLWLPLLPEVSKSPIWGSGLNSILWSEAMRQGGGNTVLLVTHPHSAYLEAALDMGILGLILLCAYFAHVWRGFRALIASPELSSTLRGFYQGAVAGLLVGVLITGLADGSLTPRPEHAFLWFAIGMMYGQNSRRPA
jgi:hypothetical protein